MEQQELETFSTYWKDIKAIYGKQVTQSEPFIVFSALKNYSFSEIQEAMTIVLSRSKFAPTVADVVEAITEIRGEDPITLEAKANKFYNELNKDFSIANDIVTTDKRGVIAFYQCFNSIRDFGNHTWDDDPFDKKAFVKAYVNIKPYWLERAVSPQLNIIKGIYHDSEKPRVKFIGKKESCLAISKSLYKDKKPILLELTRTLSECAPKQLTASNDTSLLEDEENAPKSIFATNEELAEFIKELANSLKVKK